MGKAKRRKKIGNMKTEVTTREVPNPLFMADHDEGSGNVRMIHAAINVRESAVETLYARGLLDDGQKRAADRFRAIWEAMGGAGAGAMDYTREPVDGGGAREAITDRLVRAGQEMHMAERALEAAHGRYAVKLVGYVAGDGHSIRDLTQTRRQRDTMTDMLRLYLDVLAELWGFSNSATGMRLKTGT